MNVIFASPEVVPFAKTGGLADVSGALPKALSRISCHVKVVLPFYKSVKNMRLKVKPFKLAEFNYLRYEEDTVEYIFVVQDSYYYRDNLYSEPQGDYPDNDLRFSYFSKAVVALATRGAKIDVIHCNDWQTGLVPLYLSFYNVGVKTLFTIHNIGYQGLFPRSVLEKIGIPHKFYNINGIEYYGKVSFLKAGIVYSTAVSTVSRGYSREILTPQFGCGMDGILRTRKNELFGIVNGVDYSKWDPKTDKYIACNYTFDTLENKEVCKKDLIKSINLPPETIERPLIGVISRLAQQKGIDLIVKAAEDIINMGASIVILGTGDEEYNELCKKIAADYPRYISSYIKFDDALAHKIEAGCDMFVMPSRYEPCGLNQLYSMRYGTLPIVRKTGGLDDTVIDLFYDREKGNGIKFSHAIKEDLIDALSRAIELYNNKTAWKDIQKRIMKLDFSWDKSAAEYKHLYEKLTAF